MTTERNNIIIKLKQQGLTLDAISKQMNISLTRVRQILAKAKRKAKEEN